MADVFISYARATADQAQRVAESLRGLGYAVWSDDELPVHRAYHEVIEQRLATAKAVLVLWSADATRSQWVRAEAEVAREAGKLVQLTLDGTPPPMPFNQTQCADLRGWFGDAAAPGWTKVIASLAELVGGRAPSLAASPARAASRAPAEPLLAVLAFDNLSGDAELAYFSDGVSEEIQETLARGAELKVVGRTSAFQLRGVDKTVRKAATELKATHVLDGSVRRAGQRVRITAQLIDCATETTLWSNRFDRELTDIFALQDEIATAVADALRIAFTPRPAEPINPAAYDLYLKARASLQLGLADSAAMDAAVAHFRAAVAVAPRFAKAWAEMAATIAGALSNRGLATATHADGVAAAETALALDPSQGVAYGALSHLAPLGCYEDRERLLHKALAASPTDPMALSYMAHFCSDVGRFRAAEDYARRALELDPGFMIAANWHANTVVQQGRYEDARPLWLANLARWPHSNIIKMNTLMTAAEVGDWIWFEAVAKTVDAAFLATPAFSDSIDFLRNLRAPDPRFAAARLERDRRAVADAGAVRVGALIALHRLGFEEAAFELADRSDYSFMFDTEPNAARQSPSFLFMARSAGVIRDRRAMRLCAKLGLCDYWLATDRWPDCADAMPYDFRAEAARVAAAG